MITDVRVPFTGHRTIRVTHETLAELEAKVFAYIDGGDVDGVEEDFDDDRDDYMATHITYVSAGREWVNTPYYLDENDDMVEFFWSPDPSEEAQE